MTRNVFKELDSKIIGRLKIKEGELIDITDPCYDKSVWCRINGVKVKPGTYSCISYIDTHNKYHWGKGRVWGSAFIKADEATEVGNTWKLLGEIGVDTGLAGYFVDKPDFIKDLWDAFVENTLEGDSYIIEDKKLKYKGFFTRSGAGDGGYYVSALYTDKDEIIGLRINFY